MYSCLICGFKVPFWVGGGKVFHSIVSFQDVLGKGFNFVSYKVWLTFFNIVDEVK